MEKIFRCSPELQGCYGPRIFIDGDFAHHITPAELRELDRLSAFGGSSSSSPQAYNMWEFASDGVNYAKAFALLLTAGWNTKR